MNSDETNPIHQAWYLKYDNQEGYGITCTNPVTNNRCLVGVFKDKVEARESLEKRKENGAKNAQIVRWSKRIHKKYENTGNWIFKKDW